MRGGRRAAAGLCAVAVLSVACSEAKNHHILTVFFDGVPPLGSPERAGDGGAGRSQAGAGMAVENHEHGPYAAKYCDGCHEPGRGNVLVAPAEKLCERCHDLDLRKSFVHGPLVAGGCLVCHDPHQSRYPYMLVAESKTFCLRCHERNALRRIAGHEEADRACTACHEAHMSDRRFLLREERGPR